MFLVKRNAIECDVSQLELEISRKRPKSARAVEQRKKKLQYFHRKQRTEEFHIW